MPSQRFCAGENTGQSIRESLINGVSSFMKTITLSELFDLNLLEALGLERASESEKQEFTQKATQVVLESVVSRVTRDMPRETREKFYALFEEGVADDARWKFIDEHVPDFEEIMFEELLKFKAEGLEVAQELNPKVQRTNPKQIPNVNF